MGRIIKRYGNRKLYDTTESRYVTLEEIARYVRAGEDVTVIENETGEDLTALAFAQIILEEERRKSGLLSLPVLRQLIQHGEQAIQGFVAQVDRGMGAIGEIGERAGRRVQELVGMGERLGSLQRRVDELVVGMDAFDVSGVWARVYRMQLASHGMGAAAALALSGLDLALWDLRCQATGWPLVTLLGGRAKPIKAYAGGIALGWQEPAALAEEARRPAP